MLVLAFLLMQVMISAKAGLVNYTDGQSNVRLHEQVPAGTPVQTGPHSHVELLLNPGSFLRLDENSSAVLDSVELTNIAVRLVDGAALIETADVSKETPIRVTTANLSVLITSRGLYRFSGGTVSVLDGKIRIPDSSMTIKKGHQVTLIAGSYVDSAATNPPDGLDQWSRQRSSDLARANAMAYHEHSAGTVYSLSGYPGWGIPPAGSAWLYSPRLSGFTFIPLRNYRSFYGYGFFPLSSFGLYGLSGARPAGGSIRGSANGRSSGSHPSYGGRMGGRIGGGHGRR